MKAPKSLGLHLATVTSALLIASCGGSGGGSDNGPSVPPPTPPSPPPLPPPPPPPAYFGAVYVGTNNDGPGGNSVVGFGRRADGTLVTIGSYDTGGGGRSAQFSPPFPRLNSLLAEDSVLAVDNRYVLVVNAGTNDVTSFRINADFSLSAVDLEPSGGTSPVSLAYSNGIVYVANADQDGMFTGVETQSGNITAMRIDLASGQLTRIAGSSLSLRARPADLEVTPDGSHLVVSAYNAGAPQLPQPTAAEVSTFRIQPDGALSQTPAGTGMSTQPNNAARRNLPNATGIEVFRRGGRQFLVAAEARSTSSTGVPGTFATLQTGSVSTWEIGADGSLAPRSQDFLLGPTVASGPMGAGFIAYNPSYEFASIASSTGAAVNSISFNENGSVSGFLSGGYQINGTPAAFGSTSPLANADGFVDIVFDSSGNLLYQLFGLKPRIDTFQIVFSFERRQELTTGLLFPENLQGLVVVDRRTAP